MSLDAHKIGPKLYQGANPPHGPELRQRGFDMVVLCALEWQEPASEYPGLTVVRAPMWDGDEVPTVIAHKAARAAARAIRAGRRVLIVCNQGRNRSGLVTALALWYLTGAPGAACMQAVQARRPNALTNPTFALYLYHMPARRLTRARAAGSPSVVAG